MNIQPYLVATQIIYRDNDTYKKKMNSLRNTQQFFVYKNTVKKNGSIINLYLFATTKFYLSADAY